MQVFVERPKKVFTFEIDGAEHADASTEYLTELGLSESAIADIQRAELKHFNRLPHYERLWRNRRLDETDWMLVADATYGGEPLSGSQKLAEIIDYRKALRGYNLTTDDRPVKPSWFK